MPRKKPVQLNMEGFPHANPYYEGSTSTGPLPVERSSIRSIHWTQMNPAWLAQECINRGTQNIRDYHPLPGRVARMDQVEGGWNIRCYLGPPRHLGLVDNAIDPSPTVEYTDYYVTDFEVEAGKMLEAA